MHKKLTKKELMDAVNHPMCFGSRLVGKTMFAKMVNELCEYKDIEDKLDIDLIVMFNALKQGFIYLDIKENNKGISKIVKFEVGGILFDKEYKVWRLTNDDRYDGAYWGSLATNKNHGIVWALTKEELL